MALSNHHVLSVLVNNQAGVLARVSNLFARRAYNIFDALQHNLTEWLDPNSSTKTALVFGCAVTPDATRSQG